MSGGSLKQTVRSALVWECEGAFRTDFRYALERGVIGGRIFEGPLALDASSTRSITVILGGKAPFWRWPWFILCEQSLTFFSFKLKTIEDSKHFALMEDPKLRFEKHYSLTGFDHFPLKFHCCTYFSCCLPVASCCSQDCPSCSLHHLRCVHVASFGGHCPTLMLLHTRALHPP